MKTALLLCLVCLVALCRALGLSTSLKTVVAPSEVKQKFNAGYNLRELNSTSWICCLLNTNSPGSSYDMLEAYLGGSNDAGTIMSDGVVLYPLVEVYSTSWPNFGAVCRYLQEKHHQNPPNPWNNMTDVYIHKQLHTVQYYELRYWGHSSTLRTQKERNKLLTALNKEAESYDVNNYMLSIFPNHVNEIRVNKADQISKVPTCKDSQYRYIEHLGCVKIMWSHKTHADARANCKTEKGKIYAPIDTYQTATLNYHLKFMYPEQNFWVGAQTYGSDSLIWGCAIDRLVSETEWMGGNCDPTQNKCGTVSTVTGSSGLCSADCSRTQLYICQGEISTS